MLSAAFSVAVALALPALGVGLVVDVSLGWLGRTMPQLPILFVAMPLRMVLGWTVIAATLAGTMMWLVEATIGALAAMTDTLPCARERSRSRASWTRRLRCSGRWRPSC
jgi:flagellar biosynthesis protein FliR